MEGEIEGPKLWTRVSSRLNAVVWELPLPTRGTRLLSQIVYRNPEMPEARVVETIAALEEAGVEVVLAGGWAVDALHCRQLRVHRDIDLLVAAADLPLARRILAGLGYRPWHSDPAADAIGHLPISGAEALRDQAMRVVEMHAAELSGLELTDGTIGGRTVRCLDPELQWQSQMVKDGIDWTRNRRRRRRRNLEAIELALARSPEQGRSSDRLTRN